MQLTIKMRVKHTTDENQDDTFLNKFLKNLEGRILTIPDRGEFSIRTRSSALPSTGLRYGFGFGFGFVAVGVRAGVFKVW